MMKHEADQLVDRLKSGDRDAFDYLMTRYRDRVINICYKFVFDRDNAEELSQEVFLTIYKHIRGFRNQSSLSTWIYQIAVSKSIDHIRRNRRQKRFGFVMGLFDRGNQQIELSDDNTDTPEELLQRDEYREIIRKALNMLPEKQKIAFTLSKIKGMKVREICDVMALSRGSVESLLHHGKQKLRKRLYLYFEKEIKKMDGKPDKNVTVRGIVLLWVWWVEFFLNGR